MNKRREYAQNVYAFRGDVASPVIGAMYPWKANARLAVSFSADVADGDLVVLVNSRPYAIPAMVAGVVYKLDYVERGRWISFTSLVAGQLTVHVLDEWNRPFAVATLSPNLISTQDLSNASWAKTGAITPLPDTFMETAATSNHGVASAVATIPASVIKYTAQADIKVVGSARYVDIGIFSSGFGDGSDALFDLVGKSIVGSGNYGGLTVSAPSIVEVSPGVMRCKVSATTNGVLTQILTDFQLNNPSGTFSFAGNINDGLRMQNIQLFKG